MSATAVDPAHMQYLLSAISHAGQLNIDWKNVAYENNIAYPRNCGPKLNAIVKKYGYKFENNAMVKIKGVAVAPATPKKGISKTVETPSHVASSAKKRAAPKKKRPAANTAKKRKVGESDEDADSEHTPTKHDEVHDEVEDQDEEGDTAYDTDISS